MRQDDEWLQSTTVKFQEGAVTGFVFSFDFSSSGSFGACQWRIRDLKSL